MGAGGVVPPPCSFTPTQGPCHRQAPVTHTESHRDTSAPTQARQLPTVPQRPVVGGQHTGTMPTQPPAPPCAAGMGDMHTRARCSRWHVWGHMWWEQSCLPHWHSCWRLLCSWALGGLAPQHGSARLPPHTRNAHACTHNAHACTCMHTCVHLHTHKTPQLHTQARMCPYTRTLSLYCTPYLSPPAPLWGSWPARSGAAHGEPSRL